MSVTYRVLSLVLALLMFATSAGFSLDMHFCQGHVKTFNINGSAKGCYGQEAAGLSCAAHDAQDTEDDHVSRAACCDDRRYLIQSHQDKVIESVNSISGEHPVKVLAAVQVHLRDIHLARLDTSISARYKPPPLIRDIPVLIQTFLL